MSVIKYNHTGGDKLDIIEIFRALGDENRIRILNLLMAEELCVCEIETILEMTQSNASRHLSKLKSAGIIDNEKECQWVYYRINDKFIEENSRLHEFLKNKLREDTQFTEDMKRLKKYKSSKFTCQQLREDKNQVVEYLRGECSLRGV